MLSWYNSDEMLVAIPAMRIFCGLSHHIDMSEMVEVIQIKIEDIPANFHIMIANSIN